MQQRFKEIKTGEPEGNLKIAAEGTPTNYLLPELLADLLEKYPQIYPQLYVLLSPDIEEFVASGELDIGILSCPPLNQKLSYQKCLEIPHIIIGKPQEPQNWDDFLYVIPRFFKHRILKKNVDSSVDGWPEEVFPRRVAAEVETIETTLAFCEQGIGVAFVPERKSGKEN